MTDLLSAEDIKKAIGAFAGEQCTPLPGPVPLPSSRAWGTRIPLRSLPSFSRPHIGPHPRGWFPGPLPSKSCTGCAPCLSHTKLWAQEGGLSRRTPGSRTKHEDQGGKEALGFWGRTQTSPLRSVEGLQTKTFFLQETPFLHPYSQDFFSWKTAHWWRSPPRTDPRAR